VGRGGEGTFKEKNKPVDIGRYIIKVKEKKRKILSRKRGKQ